MSRRGRAAGWLLGAVTLLLLAMLPPAPAYAATFPVTTLSDPPHTLPPNGNWTSQLQGSPCTLRAAIQAHNALGGTNTINLQVAGTYQLTVAGPQEDQAATGDPDINGGTLTIANTSGGAVTI